MRLYIIAKVARLDRDVDVGQLAVVGLVSLYAKGGLMCDFERRANGLRLIALLMSVLILPPAASSALEGGLPDCNGRYIGSEKCKTVPGNQGCGGSYEENRVSTCKRLPNDQINLVNLNETFCAGCPQPQEGLMDSGALCEKNPK